MIKQKKAVNNFERSSQSYLKEIGDFDPLPKEEELALWEKYKEHNDLSARDKIVASNLKYVISVAREFQNSGLSYADLIAEGNMGFMKAMDRFNYKLGYKTISYATWWIQQSIKEAIKKRNGIYGDDLPSDTEKQVVGDDDPEALKEINSTQFLSDKDILDDIIKGEEREAIALLFDCLNDREKFIISSYYGVGGAKELKLEAIGKKLNMTKERVRQIKEKALIKLRSEATAKSITSDIYK